MSYSKTTKAVNQIDLGDINLDSHHFDIQSSYHGEQALRLRTQLDGAAEIGGAISRTTSQAQL
jgi:hypothetical protein